MTARSQTSQPENPCSEPLAGSQARGGLGVGGIFIGLASVLFGLTVIFGNIAQDRGVSVFTMLAVRFGMAAILLLAVLALRRRPLLPAPGERMRLAGLGVAGYAVEAALFFAALERGEVAAVTLLFFTYPVIVTLASMALGQGVPGKLVTLSLACAMAGVAFVVVTTGGLAITTVGVALALGSAVMFSLYLLGADHVLRRTDAMSGSMWVSAWASLGLTAYALTFGEGSVPEMDQLWPIAGMAVCTAAAFVCLFAGLVRLGPVRTSIVAASEPLSATLLAALFLDQPIRVGVAVGGVLILAGAVTASLARARPNPPRKARPRSVPEAPAPTP